MKKYFTFLVVFIVLYLTSALAQKPKNSIAVTQTQKGVEPKSLYTKEFNTPAFKMAVKGYHYYKKTGVIKNDTIVIIDFDLASTEKRMFIVDMNTQKILHKSLVAHGKNSGHNHAHKFSNKKGSHQSSLGFYVTKQKYSGKHGLSLRLDGLEKGVNHNARERAIVIHSAKYVSDEFIVKHKRIGRSHGCPAIPENGYKDVLSLIDNHNLLFIYSSKVDYKPTFENK